MANEIIAQVGQSVGTGQIVNENGYRYEGANPNNYVCFGSDASPCPADNLYRIIGVFNEYNSSSGSMQRSNVVKLVKNTKLSTNLNYNVNHPNAWHNASTAYLYTYFPNCNNNLDVNYYFNNDFYNSLQSKYQSFIVLARWYQKNDTGTNQSDSGSYNAPNFYNYERNGLAFYSNGQFDLKIALMYASDYGYAVLSNNCARSTNLNSYSNCSSYNWLFSSVSSNEWLINPSIASNGSDRVGGVKCINTSGNVYEERSLNYNRSSRPTFYLKNQSKIMKGNGTSSYPYYISI